MAWILNLLTAASVGWLAYLLIAALVVPLGVAAMAVANLVRCQRRDNAGREARERAEAEARRVAEAEAARPAPRVRPTGRARFSRWKWPVELCEVDGHEGAILAVFEPYTDHSVGYLLEQREPSADNPGGIECAGMWCHPSRHFGADAIWLHRPELRRDGDVTDYDATCRALLWMGEEIATTYGDRPEPKPLRGYGSRGRRR